MRRLYIIGLLLIPSIVHAADFDNSTYLNRPLGIRLEVPEGWTLTQQTGYPSILALLLHDAVSLSLSIAHGTGGNLERLARENIVGMRATGLRVSSSRRTTVRGKAAWQLDLTDRRGKIGVRQLYLAHESVGLIVTLVSPLAQFKDHLFDLAQVVDLLHLTRPARVQRQSDSDSYPEGALGDDGSIPPTDGAQSNDSRPNRPPTSHPTSRPGPPTSRPTPRPTPTPLELDGLEQGDGP